MQVSRIPDYVNHDFGSMKLWFSTMYERGLLFHPDDRPEDIVSISTGNNLFFLDEIIKINEILKIMFKNFGNQVYEAAYPFFMKSIGLQA